mgnify:CR=1 FL=1
MSSHYPLTQDQVDEITEIFSHFDTNNNNRIEVSEFHKLLLALGGELADGEVEAGIEALDTNRNGTIEFGEFLAWWSNQL